MFYDYSIHNAEEIQRQMDDIRQRADEDWRRMESVMGKPRTPSQGPPKNPPAKRDGFTQDWLGMGEDVRQMERCKR